MVNYVAVSLALVLVGRSQASYTASGGCQAFGSSCSSKACCQGLQCNLYELCVEPKKCKKKNEVCNPAKSDPYWHCCDGFACVPDGKGAHKCEPADCVMDTNCPVSEPFCESGSCVQCFKDAHCDEENICNELTNSCVPPPNPCDPSPCGPRACPGVAASQPTICIAKLGKAECIVPQGAAPCPECDGNDDCDAPEVCSNGSCVNPCDDFVCSPKACPSVDVTQPTVCIVKEGKPTCALSPTAAPCPECDGNDDCLAPEVCSNGSCVNPCDGKICKPLPCEFGGKSLPTECIVTGAGKAECAIKLGAEPCPKCGKNEDCAAGEICDKGSCVLAPEPEPECEYAEDCDGGLCKDEITAVPAQCRFGKCIFAPMKCPVCSGVKGVCKYNSDCCKGGWCENGKCEFVYVVTEQISTGEGATEVDDAHDGDQEVAVTDTKNTGSADVFGLGSQGKTTTGGITRGYAPFSGINASGGQSKSQGSFAIGTTNKADADIVGIGAANAENGAKAIGQSTLTKTGSGTFTAGNTGADKTSPAVVSGSHGISGAASKGDGATETGTKTDSKVGLTDKWSIRTAGAGSSNGATAAGNAGSESATKGSTETGTTDKKTYSHSTGASHSRQFSIFGRK